MRSEDVVLLARAAAAAFSAASCALVAFLRSSSESSAASQESTTYGRGLVRVCGRGWGMRAYIVVGLFVIPLLLGGEGDGDRVSGLFFALGL